jgi:outer membrane protein TolC
VAILLAALAGGTPPIRASQETPPPSSAPEAARVGEPVAPKDAPESEAAPPDGAAEEAEASRFVGPTPGAPTIALAAAVRLALERNFALLDSADAVTAARWQERTARAQFVPRVTPFYQRSEGRSDYQLDLAQELPWLGGSLSASGRYLTDPAEDAPYPRTTDLRLQLRQPLLRGFGPNASFFELRNARRLLAGQERARELARQRVAIDVARAFYAVIAERQLLEVARQSLSRTETLLRSSSARLEVGMASKLDVFRAELQASQARESMVRSEASLASALERFRAILALSPGDPLEPEAGALPALDRPEAEAPAELIRSALALRLELVEARDQVDDARRAESLARQNLLPQVDLNLNLVQSGFGGSFGDAWTAGDRRFGVSVSASVPLQQSEARQASALARIQVASRERQVRQMELDVEQEVRQALRNLEQIEKSVELQKKAVLVAAQQRRLAVLRYQRGLGSNFDVVDAESSLVTARSALVQLTTSWVVARLELQRTTGRFDVLTELAP